MSASVKRERLDGSSI